MVRAFQLIVIALCLGPAAAVSSATISGQPSVVDGDTLEIDGQMIRLHAIDAPEMRQYCVTMGGKRWQCGIEAAEALYQRSRRRIVQCEPMGQDRNRRVIARCHLDGIDLGGWMVRQGWALAYRRYGQDYVADEAEAEREHRGVWAGRFDYPWDWRRR
ncbi:thermonuclease family protein [Elioraea rosea]|uniref:thermonuclease family protein n=1 Tax=Elioraea rosea TaxID=2492390 RepID=UPI00131536D7|nr:thermonuclease family protein [Elioraea rosea]